MTTSKAKTNAAAAKLTEIHQLAKVNQTQLTFKAVEFVPSSKKALLDLGDEAMQLLGSELSLVQLGEAPIDFASMASIGPGAYEIRAQTGSHWIRLFYVANFPDAIYVLDAIAKTQNKTEQVDIDRAKNRYKKAAQMSAEAIAKTRKAAPVRNPATTPTKGKKGK